MGRVLEALLQAGSRSKLAEKRAPEPGNLGEVDAAAVNTEEIPYIEVGGSAMEASAQVIAVTPHGGRRVTVIKHAPAPARPQSHPPPQSPPGYQHGNLLEVEFRPLSHSPSLMASPQKRFAPQLVTYHQPSHPVSDQYRLLLTGVCEQLPSEGSQVLLVTGPISGTGTTTVLLNLGIAATKHHQKRVIVVDANFRRPAVADRLGVSATPGLREVVTRTASIKRAIKETGQANFLALPAGDSDFQKAGWPVGEALRGTLHQLRSQFDWILVDAPSWDGGPEMVALCSACDAVFLVLRSKDLDAPVVDHLSKLIPHLGSQLGGYILAER